MTNEIEVLYFEHGRYKSRKWVEVDQSKAIAMFTMTVQKMNQNNKETLIILRRKDGEDYYLLNSQHTHKHEPKTTISAKVRK